MSLYKVPAENQCLRSLSFKRSSCYGFVFIYFRDLIIFPNSIQKLSCRVESILNHDIY